MLWQLLKFAIHILNVRDNVYNYYSYSTVLVLLLSIKRKYVKIIISKFPVYFPDNSKGCKNNDNTFY